MPLNATIVQLPVHQNVMTIKNPSKIVDMILVPRSVHRVSLAFKDGYKDLGNEPFWRSNLD